MADAKVLVGIGIGFLTGILFLLYKFLSSGQKEEEVTDVDAATQNPTEPESKKPKDVKSSKAKTKVRNDKFGSKDEFKHPWLVTTLKGHASPVTSFDISQNGKYLASTATDRTMYLWMMKSLSDKDHRSVRCNVEFDCGVLIKFSPDNRSFITSLENGNTIRVFKFGKNEDGTIGKIQQALDDYPKVLKNEILSIGMDSVGNFVMIADGGTKVVILSLKGDQLATIDTGLMKNSEAQVSPCGRFVAVCGFTPDVKVWEVTFEKARTFKGVKRAFDLSGHKAGVLSLAFSADSGRMATISKDNTWKLWRTDVEYSKGQDPSLMTSGEIKGLNEHSKVALSPDGRAIAIVTGSDIVIINCIDSAETEAMKNVFSSRIRHIMFSGDSRYIICCGDRHLKIFHNVIGYRAKITDFKRLLVSCNKNMEKRLTDQLEEARSALKDIGFNE